MIVPDAQDLTFTEGYDAFKDGRPKEDAPKESPKRESWIMGWEHAEKGYSPNAQDKALWAWDDDGGADDYEHEFDFDDD